jgi:hypothetical protein
MIFLFFRARPELVEGFLRALGDILQQVQGERRETKEYQVTIMMHTIINNKKRAAKKLLLSFCC